jgi:flagellar biosynthesis/type III secretory pathway M-ring protein FliF/YscJ
MIFGIIGGVVGLLLIGVIVVIVILLVRRRRENNSNDEDRQYVEMAVTSETSTVYSKITPSVSQEEPLSSSSTSFFSVVPYKELKFIELVGKGAFGEVWKGMCHFDS